MKLIPLRFVIHQSGKEGETIKLPLLPTEARRRISRTSLFITRFTAQPSRLFAEMKGKF